MKHRMKKREGMAGDVAYGKVREGFTEETPLNWCLEED